MCINSSCYNLKVFREKGLPLSKIRYVIISLCFEEERRASAGVFSVAGRKDRHIVSVLVFSARGRKGAKR